MSKLTIQHASFSAWRGAVAGRTYGGPERYRSDMNRRAFLKTSGVAALLCSSDHSMRYWPPRQPRAPLPVRHVGYAITRHVPGRSVRLALVQPNSNKHFGSYPLGERRMLLAHAGKQPRIDSTAWVAPDATVCGDVVIGPGARIMHGARIIGEGRGAIKIGRNCIVMENAVVRASRRHGCSIGDHCLIGPNAHVTGAVLEEQVFVATGTAVFHGAYLSRGCEVRPHATVHLRTRLDPGTIVPIGWVAVGFPRIAVRLAISAGRALPGARG
jgi:carbonic anhydrase/acetyltransferase-like protein (isoleucine patch superfamily)